MGDLEYKKALVVIADVADKCEQIHVYDLYNCYRVLLDFPPIWEYGAVIKMTNIDMVIYILDEDKSEFRLMGSIGLCANFIENLIFDIIRHDKKFKERLVTSSNLVTYTIPKD